jgi:hypothetical protein
MGEAVRRGMSIGEFCRKRRERESQFYWWGRELKTRREEQTRRPGGGHVGAASVALVTDKAGASDAGIELMRGNGRRPRISRGVDEAKLQAILAVLEFRRS